ncbi:16S rRNA processing protein RimM [Labilibacter sediminis]|nr:16S rRNA processing protein RimM [Labilibacter sediminis]
MIDKDQCIKIGYIQKPHGVKGELQLSLNSGIYADNFETNFLLLDIDNGLVPFFIESKREKSNKSILVVLESVDSESKAKNLCGCEVYVESSVFKSTDTLPSNSFVGYQVYDKQKGDIGTITEIQEISNNPLFVLDFEGNEILFPVNPDFILGVDEKEKVMDVDLPEGLIDLYLEEDEFEEDEWEQDE